MEQYESKWGAMPETIEEHVNIIMGRYIETGNVRGCFYPEGAIFPFYINLRYLEDLIKEKDWEKLNNFIYQNNLIESFGVLTEYNNINNHYWFFLNMLEALAVGNIKTLELLLPDKPEKVVDIFPLYKYATNMLIGLWYKDKDVLDNSIQMANKFVNGKRPQWERAIVEYLLRLYDKNPKEAGIQLEIVCKTAMRADISCAKKILWVPAHGLYQLASYIWDKELFQQLPMPNHKSFSKEYAVWRNTQKVQPALFVKYPESIINDILINPDLLNHSPSSHPDPNFQN